MRKFSLELKLIDTIEKEYEKLEQTIEGQTYTNHIFPDNDERNCRICHCEICDKYRDLLQQLWIRYAPMRQAIMQIVQERHNPLHKK